MVVEFRVRQVSSLPLNIGTLVLSLSFDHGISLSIYISLRPKILSRLIKKKRLNLTGETAKRDEGKTLIY